MSSNTSYDGADYGKTRALKERITLKFAKYNSVDYRVSVQGVESLWGDCRFIPGDWGS